MKNPDKTKKNDSSKKHNQLIALGGLSAVFVAVLAIQFGGSEPAFEASALTKPASPAPTDGATGTAAETSTAPATASTPMVVKDNPVLSQPVASAELKRSPFSNFWNVAPAEGGGPSPTMAPPTVTLNATMPSVTRGIAVIDGQVHFQGDEIQGWQLTEVRPRAIVLRAPSSDTVVVEMPLIFGRVELPAEFPESTGTPSDREPDPVAASGAADG